MDVENFMTWKGPCMECETPKRSGVRLFCLNLGRSSDPPSTPCYAVWCGECYHPHPEDPFRVQTRLANKYEKSEDLGMEERLKKRFQIARYGDHLMGTPFECDLFQLRNSNEAYPIHGNARYNYALLFIR